MARTGPRGPQWTRLGEGALTFHLTSGQSITVKVDWFKYRYHPEESRQYEWMPAGDDTLPITPADSLIAAIEHHPQPRPPLHKEEAEAGIERHSNGTRSLTAEPVR